MAELSTGWRMRLTLAVPGTQVLVAWGCSLSSVKPWELGSVESPRSGVLSEG